MKLTALETGAHIAIVCANGAVSKIRPISSCNRALVSIDITSNPYISQTLHPGFQDSEDIVLCLPGQRFVLPLPKSLDVAQSGVPNEPKASEMLRVDALGREVGGFTGWAVGVIVVPFGDFPPSSQPSAAS